jgi:Domain of unknown function (4846)
MMRRHWWILGTLLLGCTRPADPPAARAPDPPDRLAASPPPPSLSPPPAAAPSASPEPTPGALAARYPWLAADRDVGARDHLDKRVPVPEGFTRVPLAEGTFGAWLRGLPLEPARTAVVSYRGQIILPADHPNLTAVVDIDVGAQDLQQCADSVIRLHAEWEWSRGRRDQSYRAASGAAMPFARWALGERITVSGPAGSKLTWAPATRPDSSHRAFRSYLDSVFAWANTGSLARDTTPTALADLRPGDFVVQPGGPGHAVLVLDLATDRRGRRVVLLGQGFMPAQSFQVLHPSAVDPDRTPTGVPDGAWFRVDEDGLTTPFWPRFPWTALHRFPDP